MSASLRTDFFSSWFQAWTWAHLMLLHFKHLPFFAFFDLLKQTNAGDLPSKLMARCVFSSSMTILQFSWQLLSFIESSLQNRISPIDACVHEARFWDTNSELTFTFLLRESIITFVLSSELHFRQIAKCLCFPCSFWHFTSFKNTMFSLLTAFKLPKASQSVTHKKSSLRTWNAFCFLMFPR